MKPNGKIYVVTGAGSGMGRELALGLLERGAKVAGVDQRAETLAETASLAGAGNSLSIHVRDVTDRDAVNSLPDEVISHHGRIDGLIHCAGIIQPFVDFADMEDAAIERVVNVNLWGTINVNRALLPILRSGPDTHLVNISSMGGFVPFPGQTMYSASKAAVKVLTEGIYAEAIGTGMKVSVVMPGAVATNISENSGVAVAGGDGAESQALPAAEAARIILDGIEADRLHILVGKDARSLWRMMRLMPERSIRMIQKAMSRMGQPKDR